MTEKQMRKDLIKLSKKHAVEIFPIETRGTTLGMADILFAANGHAGVIELKIAHGKEPVKIPFRPGQKSFLKTFSARCPHTFVLIWHEDYYYLTSRTYGFPDYYTNVGTLRTMCLWAGATLNHQFIYNLLDPDPWML